MTWHPLSRVAAQKKHGGYLGGQDRKAPLARPRFFKNILTMVAAMCEKVCIATSKKMFLSIDIIQETVLRPEHSDNLAAFHVPRPVITDRKYADF